MKSRSFCLRFVPCLFILFVLFGAANWSFRRFSQQTKIVSNEVYAGPKADPEPGQLHGFLPLHIAQETCKRRRLNAFAKRDVRRKVYDLFLISNELDWLDIRLNELDSEVDYFIILEADSTFQEGPKALRLLEHWQDFARFHPKMIRQTVKLSEAKLPDGDTWEHERFMRNSLFDQGMAELPEHARPEKGDVLLVSDIDEIPRPETISLLRNCAFPQRVTLRSHFYYYSFQWQHRGEQWAHPQATYFDGFDKTIKPEELRSGAQKSPYFELYNAAWHCSSCMATLNDLVDKITSFSHKGYNHPHILDRARLLQTVRNGVDLFERKDQIYDRIDNNSDIPRYLKKNDIQEKYKYILDRDPPNANFADSSGFE